MSRNRTNTQQFPVNGSRPVLFKKIWNSGTQEWGGIFPEFQIEKYKLQWGSVIKRAPIFRDSRASGARLNGHRGAGQTTTDFVQLGDQDEGVLYRIGYENQGGER